MFRLVKLNRHIGPGLGLGVGVHLGEVVLGLEGTRVLVGGASDGPAEQRL